MGLPWVRLDSNIATHDKIVALLEEKNGVRAAWMYVCALGYSGGHETGGLVKFNVLPFIHGNKQLAQMLVKHRLWEPDPEGWTIRKWGERQPSVQQTARTRAAQSLGARKANCVRWHGDDCGCWQEAS